MSHFTSGQQRTLGKILRRWGETQIDPIGARAEALERRIVELEMRTLGESMSTREYLDLCQRLRTPLVYGTWRSEHASWK